MRIDFVFFCGRHCVASTCSTSLVPMPKASAAKAPCVDVCESPQTTVIPGITNTFVGLFKDTTLVSIIGLYDFLGIVHSAGQDPAWLGHGMEGYAFCALVYFLLCYGMSHTSYRIERHFTPERA